MSTGGRLPKASFMNQLKISVSPIVPTRSGASCAAPDRADVLDSEPAEEAQVDLPEEAPQPRSLIPFG
jgi:hypothetical protein